MTAAVLDTLVAYPWIAFTLALALLGLSIRSWARSARRAR